MSGSAVAFSVIPSNIRVPLFYAEFNNTEASTSQPVQRALIIGQATTSVPSTPVPTFVPSTAWSDSQYGAGSELAIMLRAYRANDPFGEVWALPLADNSSGSAATGTIAFSGTATANGTIFLYLPTCTPTGVVPVLQIGVTSGQAAATVATNVAAAINAAYGLPVTAAPSTGTVTLTAQNKGTLGNDIPIVLNYLGARAGQALPAGISATVTAMSGGATDPVMSSLATWLASAAFDFILNPYPTATPLGYTTALMSDTTGRWSYLNPVYGHVFSAARASVSSLQSLGASLNDQHLTVLGANSNSPTSGWIWGAAYMGTAAPSLKNQPNQPVQTLTLAGVLPEQTGLDIGLSNQQTLLSAGIALAQRGPGGTAQIVRAVTTYQSNVYGQPDTSYLDTETMFTLMAVIRQLKSAITQAFPRALLADDGTRIAPLPPGATPLVVTPSIAKGFLVAEYNAMVNENLCQDAASFAAGLIVARNANDDSRLDVLFDPYLVSGLRIFAVLTQFHFQAQQQAA